MKFHVYECNGYDCEPPEPGKLWLSIDDDHGDEWAIVVHRGGEIPPHKHGIANMIAKLLERETGGAGGAYLPPEDVIGPIAMKKIEEEA